MMKNLTKTPLQRGLLFIIVLLSMILQYPQPNFDLDYFTSLASDHANNSGKGNIDRMEFPLKDVKIVVTGATSGLGLDLTKTLHKLGGTIITIGRSSHKLDSLVKELIGDGDTARIIPILADLQDLDSVAAAAHEIKSKFISIDYLINNAGLSNGPNTKTPTPQAYDMLFGVNYLSHFLLTEMLLPNLVRSNLANGSRIIQVASTAHMFVNGDDLVPSTPSLSPFASQQSNSSLHKMRAYSNSKLAQIYQMRSLARKLNQHEIPVRVVSLCPTWVATNIAGKIAKIFLDIFAFQSDGWGLAPILYAMFHPDAGAKLHTQKEVELYNDYVTNSSILSGRWLAVNVFFANLVPVPFYREIYCGICGVILLGLQKVFATLNFAQTASDAYDIKKQDALYSWSKEAIAPWISE